MVCTYLLTILKTHYIQASFLSVFQIVKKLIINMWMTQWVGTALPAGSTARAVTSKGGVRFVNRMDSLKGGSMLKSHLVHIRPENNANVTSYLIIAYDSNIECTESKWCRACSSTDTSACTECDDVYLDSTSQCKVSTPSTLLDNCQQASFTTSTECTECKDGYFVN